MKAIELFRSLKSDNISGASTLLQKTVDGLQKLDGSELSKFIDLLPETHPSMAPILSLWQALKNAVETGASREEILQRAMDFLETASNSREATVKLAVEKLSTCQNVVTISHSSLVEAALVQLSKNPKLHVVVGESRPMREGINLARVLHSRGIKVTLVVDMAAVYMVKDADCVVVGADAVTPDSVINKVGTFALALAAREYRKPVFVLASVDKFLCGPAAERLVIPTRDPSEIVENVDFEVRNFYFDVTPRRWVEIVSDSPQSCD